MGLNTRTSPPANALENGSRGSVPSSSRSSPVSATSAAPQHIYQQQQQQHHQSCEVHGEPNGLTTLFAGHPKWHKKGPSPRANTVPSNCRPDAPLPKATASDSGDTRHNALLHKRTAAPNVRAQVAHLLSKKRCTSPASSHTSSTSTSSGTSATGSMTVATTPYASNDLDVSEDDEVVRTSSGNSSSSMRQVGKVRCLDHLDSRALQASLEIDMSVMGSRAQRSSSLSPVHASKSLESAGSQRRRHHHGMSSSTPHHYHDPPRHTTHQRHRHHRTGSAHGSPRSWSLRKDCTPEEATASPTSSSTSPLFASVDLHRQRQKAELLPGQECGERMGTAPFSPSEFHQCVISLPSPTTFEAPLLKQSCSEDRVASADHSICSSPLQLSFTSQFADQPSATASSPTTGRGRTNSTTSTYSCPSNFGSFRSRTSSRGRKGTPNSSLRRVGGMLSRVSSANSETSGSTLALDLSSDGELQHASVNLCKRSRSRSAARSPSLLERRNSSLRRRKGARGPGELSLSVSVPTSPVPSRSSSLSQTWGKPEPLLRMLQSSSTSLRDGSSPLSSTSPGDHSQPQQQLPHHVYPRPTSSISSPRSASSNQDSPIFQPSGLRKFASPRNSLELCPGNVASALMDTSPNSVSSTPDHCGKAQSSASVCSSLDSPFSSPPSLSPKQLPSSSPFCNLDEDSAVHMASNMAEMLETEYNVNEQDVSFLLRGCTGKDVEPADESTPGMNAQGNIFVQPAQMPSDSTGVLGSGHACFSRTSSLRSEGGHNDDALSSGRRTVTTTPIAESSQFYQAEDLREEKWSPEQLNQMFVDASTMGSDEAAKRHDPFSHCHQSQV